MQRTGLIGHRNFQHTVRYTQSVADAVQGLLASAPRPGALCAMPIVPSRCERRSSSFSSRDDLGRDSSDPSATVRHRLATSAGGDKGQHSVHQKHHVPFDADKRRNSARVASGSKS